MNRHLRVTLLCTVVLAGLACTDRDAPGARARGYFGTLEPFAAEAVYFLLTDRFVDGDPANNQLSLGAGELRTFDRPIHLNGEAPANIGYLGGDFKGILDNADYLEDLGFTSIWITPIVDNPDEAFTGGIAPGEGLFADQGKTGYHGYWGVNFFIVDEHLESPGLAFANFTRRMRDEHSIKIILDIVCNHGSPAYSMSVDQPKYGELYDSQGRLLADHQNLLPGQLDPANPLHAFYNNQPDIAQLSDFREGNPDVLEYFVAAYLQWIDQGAAAFRIDTIKHMPHAYWKSFSDRIRAVHPDFFMFAESYSFDASDIAQHTWPVNGAISVLDFPGQRAMNEVFAGSAPYSRLLEAQHLDSQLYQNPYELMTFYDNHDMARMRANEDGFIDAHHWLFTSRGIPVVYYGSEIAFQAGAREHGGNRNYFGAENIERAKHHPIQHALASVANMRKDSVALQRGLQVNLAFAEDTAVFYRVYSLEGQVQTALVLLNKGDEAFAVDGSTWLGELQWRDPRNGTRVSVKDAGGSLAVDAHGLRVLLADAIPVNPELSARLDELQRTARRRTAL